MAYIVIQEDYREALCISLLYNKHRHSHRCFRTNVFAVSNIQPLGVLEHTSRVHTPCLLSNTHNVFHHFPPPKRVNYLATCVPLPIQMPNDPGQLGRLELAIRAIQTGQLTSVRKAAQLYDIPRTTLRDRLTGTKQRLLTDRTKRKLTETEEDTLLRWILTMDARGTPLRPTTVRNMADFTTGQPRRVKASSYCRNQLG